MSSVATKMMPASLRRSTLAGLAVLYLALLIPVMPQLPFVLLSTTVGLIGTGLWLSHVDLAGFRIPDRANAVIAALGVVSVAVSAPDRLVVHLLAGAVGWACLWALGEVLYRRSGRDALGQGDAKLFGAAGVWVGAGGLPSVLLLGTLLALAWAVLTGSTRSRIAFGPFLAISLHAVWLYGPVGV